MCLKHCFSFSKKCSCCSFVCPQKKTFPNKRGPPSLQKEVGAAPSGTVGGEKQEKDVVQRGEEDEEDKEKKLVRSSVCCLLVFSTLTC